MIGRSIQSPDRQLILLAGRVQSFQRHSQLRLEQQYPVAPQTINAKRRSR
jgi:hypothetical protein